MFKEIGKIFLKNIIIGALDGILKSSNESASKVLYEVTKEPDIKNENISICDNKNIKYWLIKDKIV